MGEQQAYQLKITGLIKSLFWASVNGGLTYYIAKNYWKKSGWGKFGTLWFGTSAVANVAGAVGLIATPSSLIAKALDSEKKEEKENSFIGPQMPSN